MRLVLGLSALLVVLGLTGCGPRDKIGDRLIGQDSVTNGRSQLSNQQPQKSP